MGKLGKLTSLVFSLLVVYHSLNGADGQDTCRDAPTLDNKIPNIFDITDLSYIMTVEANLAEKKKTLYVTESYDHTFGNGRLQILNGGAQTTFLYLNESAEIFTVKDYECKTQDLNKAFETPFDDYNVYNWINTARPIIGPSSLLFYGVTMNARQETDLGQSVRGIKTNVWRLCDNNGRLTIRYFFIDPKTENGFGIKGKNVPARITVEGTLPEGGSIIHTYDIVNFQTFVPDIANAFKIPKMVGCERKKGAGDEKQVPSYENRDFHLEAEIVYTPWGSSNFSYVSTLSVTMDSQTKHFAYETNTWRAHKDAEVAEPGDELKIIYDIKNEYKYVIDESFESCDVLNVNEQEEGSGGFKPTLKLPDGQVLDLLSSDLFIRDKQTVSEYHYLGDDVERGIPVSVFEKRLMDSPDDLDIENVIITRYHLADDTFLNTEFSENNAPIKIVYSNFNVAQSFIGIVVFNIYAFTSTVTKKREYFDVTPCFKDNDQTKWFQLVFPMRENKPDDVIPFIPYIEDNFLNLLQVPLVGSPLRIPKVMVDVDMDNVYVTAQLLERPDFMLDFMSQGSYKIKDQKYAVGITTQEKCAKACLEKPSCQFFSYCGAICNLALDDPGIDGQEDDKNCEMFMHDKYDIALLTMDEITANIAGSVEMGSISFILPTEAGKAMSFLATGFKDGIAFGQDATDNRPEEDVSERFTTLFLGQKFDETISKIVTPLGAQSFATCRRACLNNPQCETLSFCQATSECTLSQLHAEQIDEKHVKQDWQCAIMHRAYEDHFESFPGFVLAQRARKLAQAETSNGCAMACMKEKDFNCLSFDFCPSTSGKSSCLLHATHYLEVNKDETKVNADNQECGHYSKKLVYDFKPELGKAIVPTESSVSIEGVTPEQCAKYCLEDHKISCQTFETCQTLPLTLQGRTCRLFSKTKDAMVKKEAPLCKIYERSARVARSAPLNQGYKKSTVGGVGFFLFLVGLAIGVAGMFAYGYYQANRR